MLLFLLTIVSVDVIIVVTNGEPLKSYRYHRKGFRSHQYKRRNDYNYNDWDEKKEDYYQLLLSTTKVSKETISSSFPSYSSFPFSSSYTSTLTLPPTTKSSEVTSPATEVTSPTTTTQLSTTETNLSTTVTSTVIDTTLSSTTASTISETTVTADKMFENFTIEPTTSQPVLNHIVYEINKIKKERREGDFTASLILLLQIANAKDSGHLIILLKGVNSEVMRLNTDHQLVLFGPLVMDRITSVAMAAVNANRVEEVRGLYSQLQFLYNCIHNRRGRLSREVNSIIDVTDSIYNEDDVNNVADAIRDLELYPHINKEPEEIAKALIEAFIFKPFKRIQGTTKERLLLMEIDYAVDKLIKAEGVRRNFGETKPLKTTKSIMDYIIESNYVTNKTVIRKVKKRMKKYKYKRRKDKKKKISRGITTKKTIEVTTKKVKMHKSKYYIRKYVKKDLYKMTTTIKTKNTRDKFKYYGTIRKKKQVWRRYIKGQSYVDQSEDDYYYSDDHDDDYNVDDYSDNDVSSEAKYKTPLSNTIPYNIEKKYIKKTDDTDYDEESKLKLNLRDALIHTDRNGHDYRRVLKQQLNVMRDVISDELVLKKNIYKVFGYKDK